MKFTVYSNELKAVQYFASKDSSRYILNGVNIEYEIGKSPIISATDGRRIITLKSQAAQEPSVESIMDKKCNIVISSKCLAIIQKLFAGNAEIQIHPGDKQSITIINHASGLEVTDHRGVIDGNFPNFRMVLPRKSVKRTPISSIGINSAFLANLDAVASALHIKDSGVHVQFVDVDNVIVIKFDACSYVWIGVMPLRIVSAPELWEPDFLDLPAELNAPSPITP